MNAELILSIFLILSGVIAFIFKSLYDDIYLPDRATFLGIIAIIAGTILLVNYSIIIAAILHIMISITLSIIGFKKKILIKKSSSDKPGILILIVITFATSITLFVSLVI